MSDEKLPSTIEIREQARRFVQLLDDPHPGLFTWVEARTTEGRKLYDMLGKVLPPKEGP